MQVAKKAHPTGMRFFYGLNSISISRRLLWGTAQAINHHQAPSVGLSNYLVVFWMRIVIDVFLLIVLLDARSSSNRANSDLVVFFFQLIFFDVLFGLFFHGSLSRILPR